MTDVLNEMQIENLEHDLNTNAKRVEINGVTPVNGALPTQVTGSIVELTIFNGQSITSTSPIKWYPTAEQLNQLGKAESYEIEICNSHDQDINFNLTFDGKEVNFDGSAAKVTKTATKNTGWLNQIWTKDELPVLKLKLNKITYIQLSAATAPTVGAITVKIRLINVRG